MTREITHESATKLQKILSKRLGRILSDEELEQAYTALMDFAFALVDSSTTFSQEQTIDNCNYVAV